jgi:AcrR family transcriptional regulator
MGRPREHDDRTAAALLAAAERTVQEAGLDALSVRGVATEVGTSTRAVYSLFGSKDGLLAALGAHAFDLLRQGLDEVPATSDPAADLIAAGLMFRAFATALPALFSVGVHLDTSAEPVRRAGATALAALEERMARLRTAGGLGGRTVADATLQFHALCEGLAALELRGGWGPARARRIWRDGLRALVAGFADPR